MPDQVVQFEGTEHHFPDDFSQQEIAKALSSAHPLPPAMNTVPIPEGLQPQTYSQKVLSNLPSSVANFVKNAPMVPTAGPRPVQDEKGNWHLPDISLSGELGDVLSNIGNKIFNPSESFAEDPVGTAALPVMAAYGGYRGVTSPAVRAGAKEALAEVKKELPAIRKWERNATIGGAVLGGGTGHPFIGSEIGAAAGATRAIPPALRGFRRGYSGYEPYLRPEDMMPPPPGAPAARFVPGQYDTRVADVPIEVGGAHIPDYNGPTIPPTPVPAPPEYFPTPAGRFVPGQYDAPRLQRPPVEVGGAHIPDYTPPGGPATPLPDVAPVPAAAPTGPSVKQLQALYDANAKMNFKGAKFADLPEPVQNIIRQEVNKDVAAAFPAPPGTLPTPGVSEAYKASLPQVSIIPEGERNIIRKVAETNRGAKDTAIARSLKDEGFTAAKLDSMSDADLAKRVKDLGYRPSTGKNYSRTWSAFRRDLRSLLD